MGCTLILTTCMCVCEPDEDMGDVGGKHAQMQAEKDEASIEAMQAQLEARLAEGGTPLSLVHVSRSLALAFTPSHPLTL